VREEQVARRRLKQGEQVVLLSVAGRVHPHDEDVLAVHVVAQGGENGPASEHDPGRHGFGGGLPDEGQCLQPPVFQVVVAGRDR
jgi:hypothetical protein